MVLAIIGTDGDKAVFERLIFLIDKYQLPLTLAWQTVAKTNDKTCLHHASTSPVLFAVIKGVPTLLHYQAQSSSDKSSLAKITPNWQSLTRRIVSAGRKSELILQACKLTSDMTVIDATAGFGHDGLILASTGASVVMIEKNPIIALLLLFEYHEMMNHKNWQKLLGRIQIYHGDFLNTVFLEQLPKADMIYLDPMFPSESYTAKVGKNMQLLHGLVNPPDGCDEVLFLNNAKNQLIETGKIIVKRPLSAPYLANQTPIQSVANDAIRFDRY